MRSSTVVKVIFVAFVAVFVIHQIYSSVYKPITTQTAVYTETVEGLDITGVVIRDEQLVTAKTDGVYHFLIEDGARVAKGGVIANVYGDEASSITMSEIESLKAQKKGIEDLQSANAQQAADLDFVNSRAALATDQLIVSCAYGNFSDAPAEGDAYLLAANRRQLVTGEQKDFSAQLDALNQRLNELNAALPTAKGNVTAAISGYFSASTDGYETVFSGKSPEEITVDFLNRSAPIPTDEKVVGKIVSDYRWYIAAKVTMNDSLKYKVGDYHTIRTGLRAAPNLDVTVAAINLSQDTDSAVIVFSCSQMSRELAAMRTGTMTVVNETYNGLKVPNSALRVLNSKSGVYVLSGITLQFVPIRILHKNDDYMICEQEKSTKTVLRLYDEVVVKGKNLYDGKVVG